MIELTNQNTEWGNNELAEPSGKDRFWHEADVYYALQDGSTPGLLFQRSALTFFSLPGSRMRPIFNTRPWLARPGNG